MISENDWTEIRKIFNRGFNSCLHFSLATLNADGSPNIAPIGSMILKKDPSGFYVEEYARQTRSNLERDRRICVMAVNASKLFWIISLYNGRFSSPPSVNLSGFAGDLREATPEEMNAWQRRISKMKGLKGYALMWGNMHSVRDLYFDSFEFSDIGEMTRGLR